MKWFKRKHDYFVSYAHPNGFGNFNICDVVIYKPIDFKEYLRKRIEAEEKLSNVVILNWIRL